MVSILDPDADPRDVVAAQIEWLETADPDEWHRVVLDFNWGEPLWLLDWIVKQPVCDLATALTVFWVGQPMAWLEESDDFNTGEPDEFSWLNAQLCAEIAHHVAAGDFYTRSEIAFEPDAFTKKDYLDLSTAVAAMERPAFPAPRALITSRPGRHVENDAAFYARYPEHLRYSTPIELPEFEWPTPAYARVEKNTRKLLPRWLRRA